MRRKFLTGGRTAAGNLFDYRDGSGWSVLRNGMQVVTRYVVHECFFIFGGKSGFFGKKNSVA